MTRSKAEQFIKKKAQDAGMEIYSDKVVSNNKMSEGSLMKYLAIALLILFFNASLVISGDRKPVKPSPRDKCPVCGMFVAKYPDFLGEIIFKDGSYAVFDGAKDMFKYYFNLRKYNPARKLSDIDSIYVTDYYSLNFVDGFKAIYVTGSNVYGPMGKELIPFEKEAEAKEFLSDHAGKSLLKFKEVTVDLIKDLD
jgi:copper chaperone NosL